MNDKKIINIIIVLLMIGVAFYLGRLSVNTNPTIGYVKGETMRDTIEIEKLVPYKVEAPTNPTLPTKTKSPEVDTAAIINDYISTKDYNIVAFDDSKLGKLELFPTLQYNNLVKVDYNFTPIHRKETIIKKRVFIPFASGSYSTLNYIGIGGGIFYYDLGFEYQYQIGYNGLSNGHTFGLKYKF